MRITPSGANVAKDHLVEILVRQEAYVNWHQVHQVIGIVLVLANLAALDKGPLRLRIRLVKP